MIKGDSESQKIIKKIENYSKDIFKFKYILINPIKIKIFDSKNLIQSKNYKIPEKCKDRAIKELKRLESENIIERSNGSYSNPVFFIEKNKDLRLVVDYRVMNEKIVDEICNIPNIFNSIQNIGENTYFSQIDLKNGFNQILLDKDSREITAFNIMNKHWQYKRIPFGLKCGPKFFQKVISHILDGIDNCFVNIDDIIVYSNSLKDHNDTFKLILERLYERNVQINFDKFSYYKKEIKVLGYIINSNSISSDKCYLNNKIFKKQIKNKRDIQKLVGTLNWYRTYIRNFSQRISKITDLLKGDKKIIWNENCQKIVDDIKTDISRDNLLKFPNYNEKFILQCDASDSGI
ncbi:Retrovirus-related Pol polyprotein from transposon 17.6 [Dictyocoela muelleri]|nr:Retrovirus-related Pol polyprotein from transposon 17.6 [Dictyocoela muelleri]